MAITLTYTFVASTTIQSGQVNSNFTTLSTRALDKTGDTMTGNLLFTDATYDIGASGATRPRDFFLSRNATVGGTLGVTGAVTLSSTLAVTGNATLASGSGNATIVGGGATASTLRFLEPSASGTNYSEFKAQAQSGNVTYTLPAADGTSGYKLQTNGSGTLSWAGDASGVEQSFRGLHLRTSPNADVAATTVSVLGLTQWTADDGTLVDDTLTNNTAVISSSGAGGLDTGAEAASTWYEIYRIRKSSDGTLNTLLHRAKDYLLDESQTTESSNQPLRKVTSPVTKAAQTFDTDVTGYVEFVDVRILKTGSPTGRIWVEIYATSAGAPTGATLATSDKMDVSLVSTSSQVVRFVFRTPVSLTAGTTYALSIEGDWTSSDTDHAIVRYNNAGGYAAGDFYYYNGAWTQVVSQDLYFKVYVTENDTAVTMPSGYDQKCKIGYVYNNSGSNFIAFTARDRWVQTMGLGSAATITATTATLTDLRAGWLPPAPVSVEGWSYSSGGTTTVAVLGGVPEGYSIDALSTEDIGTSGHRASYHPTSGNGVEMGVIATESQAVYLRVNQNSALLSFPSYIW